MGYTDEYTFSSERRRGHDCPLYNKETSGQYTKNVENDINYMGLFGHITIEEYTPHQPSLRYYSFPDGRSRVGNVVVYTESLFGRFAKLTTLNGSSSSKEALTKAFNRLFQKEIDKVVFFLECARTYMPFLHVSYSDLGDKPKLEVAAVTKKYHITIKSVINLVDETHNEELRPYILLHELCIRESELMKIFHSRKITTKMAYLENNRHMRLLKDHYGIDVFVDNKVNKQSAEYMLEASCRGVEYMYKLFPILWQKPIKRISLTNVKSKFATYRKQDKRVMLSSHSLEEKGAHEGIDIISSTSSIVHEIGHHLFYILQGNGKNTRSINKFKQNMVDYMYRIRREYANNQRFARYLCQEDEIFCRALETHYQTRQEGRVLQNTRATKDCSLLTPSELQVFYREQEDFHF